MYTDNARSISFALKPRYYVAIQGMFSVGRRQKHPCFDDFLAALMMMGFTPVASSKSEAYCLEVPREWQRGESSTVDVPVPREVCAWWSHEYACIAQQLNVIMGWSERNFIQIPEEEEISNAILIPF
ncbi:hypothetical protein C8Q79DRAFT_1012493 [Trametes meyenii]|nr:hypothetical protein C8Q79DRAFT_1012493 [Trametes meyenii]